MTAASDKLHMGRVAGLGCMICRLLGYDDTPAMVHHCRTGVGMGRKASDTETIPLCYHHHQGAEGLHTLGRRAWERLFGVTELELLEKTRALLGITEKYA